MYHVHRRWARHLGYLRTCLTNSMSIVVTYNKLVEFGDCDPARIVWFPNYFKWIDAASRNYFTQRGVPPWHVTEREFGILGTPVVDTHAQFTNTASYGDDLSIHTRITKWRKTSFVMHYEVMRDQCSIMTCIETRVFAKHVGNTSGSSHHQIKAIPVPEFIKQLCGFSQ